MDLFSDVDPTFFVDGRFKTYNYWPFEDDKPCNKRAMAEAGFISVGNGFDADHVECFICSKQLDGWEEDDDPWEEHKKHQANCPFILLGKKDELTLKIEEIYALLKIYYLKELGKKKDGILKSVEKEITAQGKLIPKVYAKSKAIKRK